MESLLDRSTDFVRAAVAQRSPLGGVLCLDESLDLAPAAAPEDEAEKEKEKPSRPSVGHTGEEQVDYDEVGGWRMFSFQLNRIFFTTIFSFFCDLVASDIYFMFLCLSHIYHTNLHTRLCDPVAGDGE